MQLLSFRVLVVLLLAGLCAAPTRGSLITFENYSEGFLGGSFTDPTTGLFFHDSISANKNFVIEYSAARDNIPFLPGNYLDANGYSPGPGGGFADFSFTATFPALANFVSMDVACSRDSAPSGSITLTGYSSANKPLTSSTFTVSTFHITPTNISISWPSYSFAYFTLVQNNMAIGVDNIAFTSIPEPSTLAVAGVPLILFFRRRPLRRLDAELLSA